MFLGCDSETTSSDDSVDVTIEFSTETSLRVDSTAVTQTITFTTNAAWSVELSEADSIPNWISVTPMSGSAGENSITISVEANSVPTERVVYVTIITSSVSKTVTITQAAGKEIEVETSFTAEINNDYTMAISEFSDGDEISVSSYDSSTVTAIASDVKYTYNSDKFESTTPIEFDKDDETQQLVHYGVYPYSAGSSPTFSFDVESNQSTLENHKNSDLLSSTISASDSRIPNFVFYHRLSNIVISLTSTEIDLTGAVVTIYAQQSVDCNINNNTFTATGDKAEITAFASDNNTHTAIVAPQSISQGDKFMVITTADEQFTYIATSDITLNSGLISTLVFNVTSTTVSLRTDINPWGEGNTEQD